MTAMNSRAFLVPLLAFAAVACQKPAMPAASPSAAVATPAASLPPGHPAVGAGEADSDGALPPGHPPLGDGSAALPPGHAPVEAGPSGPPVSGSVTLAASLHARGADAKALYVIARKAGARDIVAVKKIEGPRFPAAFELSGADAMTPGTPFQGPFDVTARLSKGGDAIPAPGDLEGTTQGVAGGARGVTVTLDTVRQ